jgi:hypothetical protein
MLTVSAALVAAVCAGSVSALAVPQKMPKLEVAKTKAAVVEDVGWRRRLYRRYGYPVPYAYYPPAYYYRPAYPAYPYYPYHYYRPYYAPY